MGLYREPNRVTVVTNDTRLNALQPDLHDNLLGNGTSDFGTRAHSFGPPSVPFTRQNYGGPKFVMGTLKIRNGTSKLLSTSVNLTAVNHYFM